MSGVKMGYKVIVCGGRDYLEKRAIREYLDGLRAVSLVITGGARGVDSIADGWAEDRGIARAIFPANWTGEGRSAGHTRNQRMLELMRPHFIVAFPGGRGTQSMVDKARDRHVEVIGPEYGPQEMLS